MIHNVYIKYDYIAIMEEILIAMLYMLYCFILSMILAGIIIRYFGDDVELKVFFKAFSILGIFIIVVLILTTIPLYLLGFE